MQLKNSKLFRPLCFINGEWVSSEEKFSVHNPYDGSVVAEVPSVTEQEVEKAITAADNALEEWRNIGAFARAEYLRKWYYLIKENKEDIAKIMTIEQGKPLAESRAEIDYGAEFVLWSAEEGKRMYGEVLVPAKTYNRHLVIKKSVGVVAAITPWNFPMAMITRKFAPALAAGCTIVSKPAEATPLTAFALGVLAEEAGFPKGVLNIVTGKPPIVGKVLTNDNRVKMLSFTGSTRTGKLLIEQSAPTVKKLSMELGGNAPFIILKDADLEQAADGLIASRFRNSGQACICANRAFVHNDIYEEFSKVLAAKIEKLKVGNGLEEDTKQGPLINKAALEKVQNLVEEAKASGATIKLGGSVVNNSCYAPSLICEVTPSMRIFSEEIFGPVVTMIRFQDDKEVIKLANQTDYGLAGFIYSKDLAHSWAIAEQLDFGIIGINSIEITGSHLPFGGMKHSGLGREGSHHYGIEEYLEPQTITIKLQ